MPKKSRTSKICKTILKGIKYEQVKYQWKKNELKRAEKIFELIKVEKFSN